MSIDTTFRPLGATQLVGVTPLQAADLSSGCSTFRVRCITAGYLSWGDSNAVTAKGAPAAGAPVADTIGMAAGAVAYLELPYNSWFISSVADGFELTPGQGGTGG